MDNSVIRDDDIIQLQQRKVWGSGDSIQMLLLFAAIYIIIALLVPRYLLLPMEVKGSSMENTLLDGDSVLLFKQGEPQYGDIVVAYIPTMYNSQTNTMGENIIKRVIGKPGDTVWFEKQQNGAYYLYRQTGDNITIIKSEEYITPVKNDYSEKRYTLSQDEYFLLGDNRDVSKDSRSSDVGYVKLWQIKGRVMLIVRGFNIILYDKPVYDTVS